MFLDHPQFPRNDNCYAPTGTRTTRNVILPSPIRVIRWVAEFAQQRIDVPAGVHVLPGLIELGQKNLFEVFDLLAVGGNLDITGATVDFEDIEDGGTTLDNEAYVFATYDTLTGTFGTVTDLPSGYTIDYAYGGNSIALVPEPATFVLLTSLLLGVLLFRRGK